MTLKFSKRVNRFWERLERPHGALFGSVFLFSLFALVIHATAQIHLGPVLIRENAITIFGFLPDAIITSAGLLRLMQVVTLLALTAWVFHFALPVSPWITCIAFTFIAAQEIETMHYTPHMYHILVVGLFGASVWYATSYRELAKVRTAASLIEQPIMPRWVTFFVLAYLTITYTYSGLTKLGVSGISWTNGTSLQLWAYLWADADSMLRNYILEHKNFAQLLQGSVLLFETTAILALCISRLRPLYGVVLVSFHLGTELLFSFQFYGNIVLGLLVFVVEPLIYWRETELKGGSPLE